MIHHMEVAAILLALAAHLNAADWPTVHRDNQRSGYAAELVNGPYERKWFRDFHDQMIATRVEAIVVDGRCFVGTFAGSFHALDAVNGKTLWQFKAAGPIGASACYADGKVFVGADDGRLYCLGADDGRVIWSYRASAGIWVAPACDGGQVYVGDRGGTFHAIDAATGRMRWTIETGGMILTPASISADGRHIVFGSEDMHVYCASPDGKLLWKSVKLGGLSMRDHAPTIWQGLAIVTTNPAKNFHGAAGQNPAILTAAQKALPMEEGDLVIHDKWGGFTMKLTQRRLEAERRAILDYLGKNKSERVFYAFDLESGKEPWVAPVLYTAGLHNPPTAPTFNPATGELYLWLPTALSNYHVGVPGGAIAVGRLDRKTGLVDILYHTNGDKLGWAFDFVAPADETQALSLMGNVLLNTHQGIIGGMRLDNLKWHRVYIARDTYGGIFGPAAVPGSFQGADRAHAKGTLALMPNEWHGPDRAIVAIAHNRLYWVVGSQVVCLGGPDTPTMESGGTKTPPLKDRKFKPVTPAGNVANHPMGGFDDSIPKPSITPEQLRPFLLPPDQGRGDGPAADQLRNRLGNLILDLIANDYAPFVIELGLSGEDLHFWRTAQTMQIVALTLPHLSAAIREKARGHLDGLWEAGAPLRMAVHRAGGARREFYDPGPEMLTFAGNPPRYSATVEDLYAAWAYAHYADRWDRVLKDIGRIRELFEAFAARPVQFNHADRENDAAEHLNAQIAGVLAYARIMQKAGEPAQVDRAMRLLAELVSIRVHHELADTDFVRSTKTASKKLHQAKIPRYLELTPELAAMLREFAGDALHRNLAGITRDLPVWHHAFGERMIGGENYISPPTLSRGLYMALADAGLMSAPDLLHRLDVPWCRGDLYYIEKLTAALRSR